MSRTGLRSLWLAAALAVVAIGAPGQSGAQETFAWDESQYFRFNIWKVARDVNPTSGKNRVTAVFSVTDPTNCTVPADPTTCEAWDILNDPEFKQPQGLSRVAIDVGWNTTDYENIGSAGQLTPLVPQGTGKGAALPISIDALKLSKRCDVVGAPPLCGANPLPSSPTTYFVQTDLPALAMRTGVVAMEGHPASPPPPGAGSTVWQRVPVKSEFQYFAITGTLKNRREIVAIEKCKVCHDGELHDGVEIPRLALHGANRTEEIRVCAICHNPDQTDIPYRTAGSEVSVDLKRMIHSIHAGGFRKNPFKVVGFQGVLYDFSAIRFPAELRNCLNCHIDVGGKGTFELPLAAGVLGSTVSTGSILGVSVDVNPANDRKITPIAAVCSSCHDSASAQGHMSSRRQGGNFWALQSDITSRRINERCVDCHGPGRDEDVRKVHEVGFDDEVDD